MTTPEAKLLVGRLYRLAIGRVRLEEAAKRLDVPLLTAVRDDDLIVILAEETQKPGTLLWDPPSN